MLKSLDVKEYSLSLTLCHRAHSKTAFNISRKLGVVYRIGYGSSKRPRRAYFYFSILAIISLFICPR